MDEFLAVEELYPSNNLDGHVHQLLCAQGLKIHQQREKGGECGGRGERDKGRVYGGRE